MPYLTVITAEGPRRIPFQPGLSLRDILDTTDLRVRSGCRGNGLCGLCLVAIEAGTVNPPTANERLMLQRSQLEQNIRFACQVTPREDLRIRILNAAAASIWRSLPPGALRFAPTRIALAAGPAYAVAVDLGTTHISAALWDLQHGVRVAALVGPNPQARYGADVVTRLVAAGESADVARDLARSAFNAIGEALADMCSRHGVNSRQIVRVAVVGNTPMLAILTETTPQALLRPASWTRELPCRLKDPQAWMNAFALHPGASVEVISPLAGFVGSDLLTGVLATGLVDHPAALLVDFGTNSEIALWDGKTLWVTSAAGGPAFEGSGIPCGMAAEAGAIDRVTQAPGRPGLDCHVIGNGEPRGICGSGLVDWVACLLADGRLTARGKFASPGPAVGLAGPSPLVLSEAGWLAEGKTGEGTPGSEPGPNDRAAAKTPLPQGEDVPKGQVRVTPVITTNPGDRTATEMPIPPADGLVLHPQYPAIRLDARGVDLFQRAKAAIGVGIRSLLAAAHMPPSRLQRICVCGAFGQYLDVRNAQAIGLLPPIDPRRVELCGNTALSGCEFLLLSPKASADLDLIRGHATIMNLAQESDFDSRFLECLYLQPLEASGP